MLICSWAMQRIKEILLHLHQNLYIEKVLSFKSFTSISATGFYCPKEFLNLYFEMASIALWVYAYTLLKNSSIYDNKKHWNLMSGHYPLKEKFIERDIEVRRTGETV